MFKIKKLHLENYRGFSDITIDFGDNVTCIAGVNGAGKTSCLDAIATNLSWVTEMIKLPPYKNGIYLKPEEKKKGSVFAAKIETLIIVDNTETSICVGSDFAPGIKIQFADQPAMQDLFEKITKTYPLENRSNIPVIAYYPANRSELEIDISAETEKDLNNKYEIYNSNLESVIHYKDFFRWFRNQEDRENAKKLENYESGSSKELYEDKELKAVRHAISVLLPNFTKLKVDAQRLNVLMNKEDLTLKFESLADGEKGIITLFGDIARRLAIANETLENPLEGNGIILIDEIDLHLHPSWQRKVCSALVKTFPNCQFIITTHSPQVLGELQPQDIRLLNNFQISIPSQSYGLDSNSILDSLQNTTKEPLRQNASVSKTLDEISDLIDKKDFKIAREKLHELEIELNGSTPDTVSLGTEIALMEDAE